MSCSKVQGMSLNSYIAFTILLINNSVLYPRKSQYVKSVHILPEALSRLEATRLSGCNENPQSRMGSPDHGSGAGAGYSPFVINCTCISAKSGKMQGKTRICRYGCDGVVPAYRQKLRKCRYGCDGVIPAYRRKLGRCRYGCDEVVPAYQGKTRICRYGCDEAVPAF